jgi:hypothetical protein
MVRELVKKNGLKNKRLSPEIYTKKPLFQNQQDSRQGSRSASAIGILNPTQNSQALQARALPLLKDVETLMGFQRL